MKFDSNQSAASNEIDELSKYNNMYAKKEQELREISVRKVKNLEILLQTKETEINNLKSELQKCTKEKAEFDKTCKELEEQLKEYESRFAEVKKLLMKKNEKIEELEISLDTEQNLLREKVEKAKLNERSLFDKCEVLQEENKSLIWKHDQAIRHLNAELEEYKKKLKLLSKDKDSSLSSLRSQLEDIFKKVLCYK